MCDQVGVTFFWWRGADLSDSMLQRGGDFQAATLAEEHARQQRTIDVNFRLIEHSLKEKVSTMNQSAKIVRYLLFALVFLYGFSGTLEARSIAFEWRHVADNSSIEAMFYQNSGEPLVFRLSYSLAGKFIYYECPDLQWDSSIIDAASKEFARILNEEDSFYIAEFLK